MSKPVLNVPGVDPALVECEVQPDGTHRVKLRDQTVAFMRGHRWNIDALWPPQSLTHSEINAVAAAVMKELRASNFTRLWPEPPEEPLPCPECGSVSEVNVSGIWVVCQRGCWEGPCGDTVAVAVSRWNAVIRPALAAKGGAS